MSKRKSNNDKQDINDMSREDKFFKDNKSQRSEIKQPYQKPKRKSLSQILEEGYENE